MQTITKIIITSVVALIIFGSGAGTGYVLRDFIVDDQPTEQETENFSIYWEVWHHVEEQFYGEIPDEPTKEMSFKLSILYPSS